MRRKKKSPQLDSNPRPSTSTLYSQLPIAYCPRVESHVPLYPSQISIIFDDLTVTTLAPPIINGMNHILYESCT